MSENSSHAQAADPIDGIGQSTRRQRRLMRPVFDVLKARGRVPHPDARRRAVLAMLVVFKKARRLPPPFAPPAG